jgi:hypothetical protein
MRGGEYARDISIRRYVEEYAGGGNMPEEGICRRREYAGGGNMKEYI